MKTSQSKSRAFCSMALLTLGSGKMSNVVVGTLSSHHIFKVGGKISGTMPLEQIVEQDGVVCSVYVSHKTKLSDAAHVNSPAGMSLLLSRLIICKARVVGCDDPEIDEPYKYLSCDCIFPNKVCLVAASSGDKPTEYRHILTALQLDNIKTR